MVRLFYTSLLVAALTAGGLLQAQNVLPIGSWRSHLPYRIGSWVTQSEQTIYYATPQALLALDKQELSTRYITKVDGLTEAAIRMIRYVPEKQVLVVVYENSVIDLWYDGEVRTLVQIRNFTNFTGDKSINDIYVAPNGLLYLAAGYGVSALDLNTETFVFTTFTGRPVLSVATHDGLLYAATDDGVYRVPLSELNINDFNTWKWLGPEDGFPDDYNCTAINTFEGGLYLALDGSIYRLEEGGAPALFYEETTAGLTVKYLSAEGPNLIAGYRCEGGPCGNGKALYFTSAGLGGALAPGCIGRTNYAVGDQYGRVWFGDEWRDFRYVQSVGDGLCQYVSFNSPYSELNWELAVYENELWMATGGLFQTLSARGVDHGIASLKDGQWSIYNRWNTAAFQGLIPGLDLPSQRDDDLLDVITIAVNPVNGKVYAGSFYEGLLEWDREQFTLYNDANSPLQNASGDLNRTRVSGLAFDEEGTLWISNETAKDGKPIHALKADGTWHSFSKTCGLSRPFQIAVDPATGFKWVVEGSSQAGLLVFDEGELDDASDDQCRAITSSNSNLPTPDVRCIAIDLDGDVWVGTAQGIVIFECGQAAMESTCAGTLRVVERNGFAEYLFKTQTVLSMAVDGANRKWIGTTNGLYLMSADGREEILYFTELNSPLPDNVIRDIAINHETGEVFIGTDKGVVSYQSDATKGARVNRSTVKVFPNPVRPEYDGPIAVEGLARDASVKITDINGKLVFETQALGGQAIWNGRDYNGRRVQSGVYLVFATPNARYAGFNVKPEAAVTRILFINGDQ